MDSVPHNDNKSKTSQVYCKKCPLVHNFTGGASYATHLLLVVKQKSNATTWITLLLNSQQATAEGSSLLVWLHVVQHSPTLLTTMKKTSIQPLFKQKALGEWHEAWEYPISAL